MAQWNIDTPPTEYYDCQSRGLDKVVREVIALPEVAIDTETTGLNTWQDVPLYWSLAWDKRRMTLNASALPYFAEAFADPYKKWIFANAKYDAHILANLNVQIAGKLVDTQVQHSLLYEERSHRLKDMSLHLFDWRWMDFQDTFGKITKEHTPTDLIKKVELENFALLVEYASNDAWGTWQIYKELNKQLQNAVTYSLFRDIPPHIETLYDLFTKVEIPYTKVLWKNERNGVSIDEAYLARMAPQAEQELTELEREIDREVNGHINPRSTAQLRDIFFNKLNVKPLKNTKGGKSGTKVGSINEDFLNYYKDDIPLANLLAQHRKLSKLHGTYIVGLSKILDPNKRVHTTFNQDIARTGRLSSKEPNLQNIPKPENDKWNLRKAFIASPGNVLIVGDYEQLEMRILACASFDRTMIDMINSGKDFHMGTASRLFGIVYDEIVESKKIGKAVKKYKTLPESALTPRVKECLFAREVAKTVGFGLVYGLGERSTAKQLKISREEAAEKIKQFKELMPRAEEFKHETIAETIKTGYAFTILGRRRNVPQILSNRNDERAQGERIAVNTPIQGSAADVVKMAQIQLDKVGLDKRFGCHSLMQVHDELVHECPAEVAEEARLEIKDCMEHPFTINLAVPLSVDINIGNNWHKAKS